MAELNFPSMFDTRQAMDRQMQEDAHKAGVSGGAGKRYGMYYNSSLLGDQDIAFKRSIRGMFGLGGDPRMEQQQLLDEIKAQFPNPKTPQDFVALSNALGGAGLHSYAEAAMDMANEVRTSMPARTKTKAADGYYYWDDDGSRVFEDVVKTKTPATAPTIKTYDINKVVAGKEQTFTRTVQWNPETEKYDVVSDVLKTTTPGSAHAIKTYKITDPEDSTKQYEVTVQWDPGTQKYVEKGRVLIEKTTGSLTDYNETLDNMKKGEEYQAALTEVMADGTVGNHKRMNELIFAHKRAYEQLNDAPIQSYSSEIADIMDMINGETMKGGSLYDAINHPNGRKFTRLEAERKYEENKRETSEQKLFVAAGEEDIKYTNKLITDTDETADQAYRDLQSFRNILNAYEAGGQTGAWEESILKVKGILRTLGFKGDINELVGSEVLLAEFNRIALSRMSQLSGSASDKDVAFVVSGGPSYDKSPEANMLLIQGAMHVSREAQHQNEFLNKYVSQYLQNHDGSYPKSWELNAAMEAFRNRGDTDENAVARYSHIWNSEDFLAVGSRESLVATYGNNQFDGWGKYDKIQSGEITLVNATQSYQATLERAREIAAEE